MYYKIFIPFIQFVYLVFRSNFILILTHCMVLCMWRRVAPRLHNIYILPTAIPPQGSLPPLKPAITEKYCRRCCILAVFLYLCHRLLKALKTRSKYFFKYHKNQVTT